MVPAQLARSCRLLGAVMVAGAIPLAFGVTASSASGVTLDPPTPPTLGLPSLTTPTLASPAPTVPGLPVLPPTTLPSPPSGGSVPPGLPGAPGGGGGTPTDPCAQITGPAAAQGAPISATCPITPTSDGGVDIPLCIDVAQQPSCSSAKSSGPPASTTTTRATGDTSSGANHNRSRDTPAPNGSGDPPNSGSSSDPASSVPAASAHRSGATLPFTGGEVFALLTAGCALAGAGAALARAARRAGMTL